jgi:hypothetical protein
LVQAHENRTTISCLWLHDTVCREVDTFANSSLQLEFQIRVLSLSTELNFNEVPEKLFKGATFSL